MPRKRVNRAAWRKTALFGGAATAVTAAIGALMDDVIGCVGSSTGAAVTAGILTAIAYWKESPRR